MAPGSVGAEEANIALMKSEVQGPMEGSPGHGQG